VVEDQEKFKDNISIENETAILYRHTRVNWQQFTADNTNS
jgi:hypothetical protein